MAETGTVESADPKEDEGDFLSVVRERYQRCIEADRDNRERAREALAFRDLEQWDERAKNERQNDPEGPRPCLVVDKLNQHVHQVVNDERQNRPQIKARPADDYGDPEVAKIYDGILRHIQARSHADVAYDTGFECAVDGGFGWWRLLTEYCDPMSFDQDFRIVRVRNRFSAYLDPERQEPDGSDAKYGFLLYKVQQKEFKLEFGKKGEDALGGFEYEGKEFTEWYGDDWVIYAEYFWRETKAERIAELADGQVMRESEVPEGMVPVRTRETETCKIRWRKLTGTKILDEGDIVFDAIPIIEVVGNELDIEGRVRRSGMIRGAMDAQRVDNYATSAFIENVALAPRSSWVAAAGQLEGYEADWRSANRRNISTLFYKPIGHDGVLVPPPQRQAPPGIPAGWLAVLGQSEHNIQASMGRYNASLGEESNEKSGRAIANRNRESDTGSFHFSDNLSRSMRHTGQMIVNAIPKVMTRKQVARIIGEDGTPGTAIIDPKLCGEDGKPCAYAERPNAQGKIEKIYNLGVGKYDVVVVTGPSYTTRRLESADAMMEISRGNNEFLSKFGDIIFKSQDWPGADQIAERFKKMLPPELQEEDDGQDREGQIARRESQVQAAVQALGGKEAEIQAAQQNLEAAAQEIGTREEKAKDALVRVQAEIEKLNAMQAGIENDRQLFDLQKKLAAKELEAQSAELESEKEVAQAEAKLIEERLNSKLAEVNAAAAANDKSATESSNTSAMLADAMQAIAEVRRLALAPRRATIEYDDRGEPVGSVSVPVLDSETQGA